MRLSAIIVNYHSLDPMLGSLPALVADAAGIEHELVVVDNSPGDGAETGIRARWPAVRWLANPENVGFARAVNRGIESSTGEFVLVLNPDCELAAGALAALISYMTSHPRCAIAGPRLESPDGRLQYSARRYPGAASLLFNR